MTRDEEKIIEEVFKKYLPEGFVTNPIYQHALRIYGPSGRIFTFTVDDKCLIEPLPGRRKLPYCDPNFPMTAIKVLMEHMVHNMCVTVIDHVTRTASATEIWDMLKKVMDIHSTKWSKNEKLKVEKFALANKVQIEVE